MTCLLTVPGAQTLITYPLELTNQNGHFHPTISGGSIPSA